MNYTPGHDGRCLWPQRKGDLEGRKARTRRDITNGNMTVPAGSIVTLRTMTPGFRITGELCPHCGVRAHVSRVGQDALTLLPE